MFVDLPDMLMCCRIHRWLPANLCLRWPKGFLYPCMLPGLLVGHALLKLLKTLLLLGMNIAPGLHIACVSVTSTLPESIALHFIYAT